MCTEVLVKIGKTEIYTETVGELARALGVSSNAVSNDPDDCCLCNAHFDQLGARWATEDEGYPFPEFVIDRT